MTVYDDVVKAWDQERLSKELQPLKAGFFKEVSGYVRRLKEGLRNLDQKSLKAVILHDELNRLERLVSQLIDMRVQKAYRFIQTGPQMIPGEQGERQAVEAFGEIGRYYERLKEDIAQGRDPQPFHTTKKERLTVRFLKDVPSIIGVDLRTYGPFLKEDVAVVPYENAESLIRQGAAAEIAVPGR